MRKLTVIFILIFYSFAFAGENEEAFKNGEIIVLQSGNTLPSIPPIPEVSLNRYAAQLTHPEYKNNPLLFYENRFNTVLTRLTKQYDTSEFSVKKEIIKAAQIYNIDPVHILAAIMGEHTFNVDLLDSLQTYGVRLKVWKSFFSKEQHPFLEISHCPEMNICSNASSEAERWDCYSATWERKFRGKMACDKDFTQKNSSLMMTFFDPRGVGKTYGFGQMGPILILSLTDRVSQASGFPFLKLEDIEEVYKAALDPRITIHYIAAQIATSIEIYKIEAGFDISQNPGITATLYNLGLTKNRARSLKSANQKQIRANQSISVPQVNYYGWLINYKEAELRNFLNTP